MNEYRAFGAFVILVMLAGLMADVYEHQTVSYKLVYGDTVTDSATVVTEYHDGSIVQGIQPGLVIQPSPQLNPILFFTAKAPVWKTTITTNGGLQWIFDDEEHYKLFKNRDSLIVTYHTVSRDRYERSKFVRRFVESPMLVTVD